MVKYSTITGTGKAKKVKSLRIGKVLVAADKKMTDFVRRIERADLKSKKRGR